MMKGTAMVLTEINLDIESPGMRHGDAIGGRS
jgi:hypothetical protein